MSLEKQELALTLHGMNPKDAMIHMITKDMKLRSTLKE